MRVCFVIANSVALLLALLPQIACAGPSEEPVDAVESRIPVGRSSLYARAIGQGRPVIVLHGGPDFDHSYLLPDLDRLEDVCRLIYYDQRGRGRSAEGVLPQEVTLASEMADLDAVRQHFGLEAPVLLGHSWGSVLALEYALRFPNRVSQLILVNPGPAAASDVAIMRHHYLEQVGEEMDRQRAILASDAYRSGDPDAVIARYRIHFKPAFARVEDYDRLMVTMASAFVRQGSSGIVEARAVEDQLMRETWQLPEFDMMPRLRELRIPVLVVTGDHDFIPPVVAEHIAQVLPNAEFVNIPNCGHFAFLECPDQFRDALTAFLRRAG